MTDCPDHVLAAIERIKNHQSTVEDHALLLQYRGSGQNCNELQKMKDEVNDSNCHDCYKDFIGDLPPSLMI